MELEWTRRREAGVALVSARLRNGSGLDRRVRLRNLLPGPVLPPRTEGVPEAGWDRDGVTVRVQAGETVAIGYACPVADQAADPPLVVADVGAPATPATDANHAIRRLGDPRPPRAVVADASGGGNANAAVGQAGGEGVEEHAGTESDECDNAESDECDDAESIERGGATADDRDEGGDTEPVRSGTWLSAVRERIAAASDLEEASVAEAATVLESTDSVGDVAALETALAADERALRCAGGEAAALADRAAEADPPVEALRRLA